MKFPNNPFGQGAVGDDDNKRNNGQSATLSTSQLMELSELSMKQRFGSNEDRMKQADYAERTAGNFATPASENEKAAPVLKPSNAHGHALGGSSEQEARLVDQTARSSEYGHIHTSGGTARQQEGNQRVIAEANAIKQAEQSGQAPKAEQSAMSEQEKAQKSEHFRTLAADALKSNDQSAFNQPQSNGFAKDATAAQDHRKALASMEFNEPFNPNDKAQFAAVKERVQGTISEVKAKGDERREAKAEREAGNGESKQSRYAAMGERAGNAAQAVREQGNEQQKSKAMEQG